MTRYFRRIGERKWREIPEWDYHQEVSVSPELFGDARVTFARLEEKAKVAHVTIVGNLHDGAVYVMDGERKLFTTCFSVNEVSYRWAIKRAHEWCEQRGYVVDDVRLEE